MPLLTIASLTLREALRRRIVLVAGIASIVTIGLASWGLAHLVASAPAPAAGLGIASAVTIFLAFVFSVVLAVGAAFLAAPAIAGDIESGVVQAILPRPLSRTEFVIGKWLGLATLLAAYATLAGGGALIAIALVAGYRPPHPLGALGYLVAQSLIVLSLALLLSTRLATIAAGLLAVACFGVTWIAGIIAGIALALHNLTVVEAATVVGLLFPSDGLWRAALYDLQPVIVMAVANAGGAGFSNPFGTTAPAGAPFLAWCAAWIVGAVALASFSFARRDV